MFFNPVFLCLKFLNNSKIQFPYFNINSFTMSDLNNFRVVINLSNFFSDHRHRARIFINKNIQTIQALQEKVSHLFGIKNFHLTSQNEFLPPSEDVRVLQNNEVLWATPSNPDQILEQSQPEFGDRDDPEPRTKLNYSLDNVTIRGKPKKRKKSQPVVEETIEEPYPEPIKKKKLKKSKKKDKSVEECIVMDTSNVSLIAGTEEPETGSKSDVYEKTSPSISFGGSSSIAPLSYKKNRIVPLITDQYLKQNKVNIVKIDFVAGSLASLKDLELKETRKLGNECLDFDPETGKNPCEIPEKSVEEQSVGDKKHTEEVTSSSSSRENTLTSQSKFKVDAGISKQDGCDKVPVPVFSYELRANPPKTLPQPKFFKTPNWRKEVSRLIDLSPFEEKSVVQNEPANVDKLVSEEKTEVAAVEMPSTENALPALNVEPQLEQSPKISQASEVSPACYIEMSSLVEDETLQTTFEVAEFPVNGSEAVGSEMGKTENGSLEMSGVHRIYKGGSSKPFKKISGVGTLLEGLRASTLDTSLDTTCEPDTSEFVTRRVRKRSRKRQKKSVSSTDYSDQVMETYQSRPMNVKGSPAIHIKFSEDEQIYDATGGTVEAEGSNCVSMNGSKVVLVDSENDEVRVKEKDILNSPLMTTLLPRAGDLIAFKVLKLSNDYAPEMSSYIVAKVLSFNSCSKCVNFQILSGLDQCQDPEGKFSMDLDSYEATNSRNRTYDWAELIEPRLIFP